jgi:hypothetical protein
MGKKYLIDTNTLIDAQTKSMPQNGLKFLKSIIDEDFTISFITYIEFLGYKAATKDSENFIALADMIEINKPIIDICIALRKAQRIKLPDAIIAATALVYDLTIISRNISDFNNIAKLQVIDLHNL